MDQKILESVEEIYGEKDWLGFIKALEDQKKVDFSDDMAFKWANAQHQLRNYNEAIPVFRMLTMVYKDITEQGASARRMLAHGLLQRDCNITEADKLMQEIPGSLSRDNLRMNIFLEAARAGIEIPLKQILSAINLAISMVPYQAVNAHVISNAVFTLHIARNQEGVKTYLPVLPGLMEIVIGIYEFAGVAKNHLAGACGRGSLIFEAAGENWWKGAKELADDAVDIWKVFNSEQGGKYQKKVDEALGQQGRMNLLLLNKLNNKLRL